MGFLWENGLKQAALDPLYVNTLRAVSLLTETKIKMKIKVYFWGKPKRTQWFIAAVLEYINCCQIWEKKTKPTPSSHPGGCPSPSADAKAAGGRARMQKHPRGRRQKCSEMNHPLISKSIPSPRVLSFFIKAALSNAFRAQYRPFELKNRTPSASHAACLRLLRLQTTPLGAPGWFRCSRFSEKGEITEKKKARS